MKKFFLLSVFISLIVSTTAQLGRDYRNCPIPDKEPEVMVVTEGVCCCEFVYNYNPPSSNGRMLYVEDSLELFINKTTMGGMLIEGQLHQMCAGSIIRMYKQDDPSGVYRHFVVNSFSFIDPIFELGVEIIGEDGELAKNQNFCLEFDANCAGSGGCDETCWPLAGNDPVINPVTGDIFTTGSCIASIVDTTDSGICVYPTLVSAYSNNGSSEMSSFNVAPGGVAGTAYTVAAVSNFNMAAGSVGMSTYTPTFENSFLSMFPTEVTTQSQDPSGQSYTQITPDTIEIGSTSASFIGAHYAADYSANFQPLSIPHVGFVNGLLNGYVPCAGTLFGQGVTGPIEYVYSGIDADTFMYCNSPVGNMRFIQATNGVLQLDKFDGDLQKSLIIDNDPQSVRMQVSDMVDGDNGKVQCGENFAEMSTNNATENTKIRIETNMVMIEGGPSQNFRGAEYAYDHSADYTDRSLVDKEFVVDSIAALQMPNIAPANAGDIVTKFNTLLTYLIAAGLMAP